MAKRFHFNLQAVLRYREIQEDERRREFLEAQRLVDEEKVKRAEMDRERVELQDEIVLAFEQHAPIQSVMASYHMIGRLESGIAESLQRQQKLEQEVEIRRQAMIAARQQTRMMETLKEQRREEYVREMDRVEQAFMDELSIQTQGRRLREAQSVAEAAERQKALEAFEAEGGE